MNNQEKYELLENQEIKLPSNMGVIPGETGFIFSEEQIKNALQSNKDFKLIDFERIEDEDTEEILSFEAGIKYQDEEYHVELVIFPMEQIDLKSFGFGNLIEESEINAAEKQSHFMEISMYFGEEPLDSFHLQLKLLNAIVPVASVVIDFMPFRLLSGKWLHMTAASAIPPSPDYLYIVHSVYSGEGDDVRYWLHTHGLHRCGSIELEMVNIGQYPQQLFDMLNIAAKMFIAGNATKSNETFTVGYDGLGIQLCWVPWEKGVENIPEDAPGGINDRGEEEDDIHKEPSGILFAVEEGHLVSPEIYGATLSDNPLYFISNSETLRMSLLAKERFPTFRDVFIREGGKKKKSWNPFSKKDDPKWTFLVKMGLTVDDAKEENEREHLWFDVLNIEDDMIEAELINEPYWIKSLKKGDKKKYPLDLLTDWIIYAPDNTYTTDSIYRLQ